MDFLQEFKRIMKSSNSIALASCVHNNPNVRLVIYYYDEENSGKVYFSTFNGSDKVKEIMQNDKVAFSTVPANCNEHVRVTKGIMKKSELTMPELVDMYSKKYPNTYKNIPQSEMTGVYEISFSEANVILGVNQVGKVIL